MNKTLLSIIIITLVLAGLFFSPNYTGQAIGNLDQDTSSTLSGILIIVAIITTFIFFYFRKAKIDEVTDVSDTP